MKDRILNVRVEQDVAEALTRHKEETGVPSSEFIRRTLRKVLLGPAPIETRASQPVLLSAPREEAR